MRSAGGKNLLSIPEAYLPGYLAARKHHPDLAEAYIRHTTKGDPLADAVAEDLTGLAPDEVHAMLAGALDGRGASLSGIPVSLGELLAEAENVPNWYDRGLARVASRAFLRNSDIVSRPSWAEASSRGLRR